MRRGVQIVALAMALSLATACGGDEPSSVVTATTAPAATATPTPRPTLAPASAEPRTLSTQAPTATTTPKPIPTTQAPAPAQPAPAEPAATGQVDACAVLTAALDAALGGGFEEPSGDGSNCFIFADDPVAFFLYPAADFDLQAGADRPAAGEPLDGLGERALFFAGQAAGGGSDAVLVQSGAHTFLLTLSGVDRDGLLAVSQAVIDNLP